MTGASQLWCSPAGRIASRAHRAKPLTRGLPRFAGLLEFTGFVAFAGMTAGNLHGADSAPALPATAPLSAPAGAAPGSNPQPPLEPSAGDPYSPKVLFCSVSGSLKPDWASQFLPPISAKLASRTHLALALGSVLAEGYLAAQAEDSQHTRNLNKDLLSIAKPLGIQTELLERSKSLSDSAEKKAWEKVSLELDATEADLLRILRQNKDEELVHLVRIGAWIRATEAVSQLVCGNYTQKSAELLHHRELALQYSSALASLSDKTRADATVAAIFPRLMELGALLRGTDNTPPTEDEIKKFAQTARSVLHDILSKP